MIPKWSQSINLVNLMWLPGGHQVVPNRVRIEEGECARIARPFLLLVKESLGKLEFFMFMQFCFIFKSSVWVRALYDGDGDDDDDDDDYDDDDDDDGGDVDDEGDNGGDNDVSWTIVNGIS